MKPAHVLKEREENEEVRIIIREMLSRMKKNRSSFPFLGEKQKKVGEAPNTRTMTLTAATVMFPMYFVHLRIKRTMPQSYYLMSIWI